MLVEKPIQCHLCTAIQEYNPYTVSTRGLPFPHFLVVLHLQFFTFVFYWRLWGDERYFRWRVRCGFILPCISSKVAHSTGAAWLYFNFLILQGVLCTGIRTRQRLSVVFRWCVKWFWHNSSSSHPASENHPWSKNSPRKAFRFWC